MQYPHLLVACAAAFAGVAQAAANPVQPPPLPPGTSVVRLEVGMSAPERERQVRAHHHKGHHKKDVKRDDSQVRIEPGDTSSPFAPRRAK